MTPSNDFRNGFRALHQLLVVSSATTATTPAIQNRGWRPHQRLLQERVPYYLRDNHPSKGHPKSDVPIRPDVDDNKCI